MTPENTQTAIVLRDREGSFYLISQDVLEAHRVPEDKKQAVKQALSGEVASYVFDDKASQNAFMNNAATGNPGAQSANTGVVYVGGLALANRQLLDQGR